jgi:hypothetical protein
MTQRIASKYSLVGGICGWRLASASRHSEELPELPASRIKRSLLIFAAVVQERPVVFDHLEENLIHGFLPQRRVVVEIPNELAAQWRFVP